MGRAHISQGAACLKFLFGQLLCGDFTLFQIKETLVHFFPTEGPFSCYELFALHYKIL